MGVLNLWNNNKPAPLKKSGQVAASLPTEMMFRFLENGQVIFYSGDGMELLQKGYMDNHVVFTIMNFVGEKVASAPPLLYEIKDNRSYQKYKSIIKSVNQDTFDEAVFWKKKGLVEVSNENHEIMKVFKRPNKLMSWFEFAYGTYIYKNAVGSSYWLGTRSGSVNDPTIGKIKEITLPPAHLMQIVSGGRFQPIDKYFLSTNPEVQIDAKNVHQIRNFSPDHTTETQWLYGMSKLHPAKKILQKYNESVDTEVDIYAKKGIREIIFPKNLPENSELDYEQFEKTRDAWNQKINETGSGNIMINNQELGSLTVGFTPEQLGVLSSQKITKGDFCALFKTPSILFGWSEQTTYNNLSESRKIALTDAVIPELEAMKDGLNSWLLPSYDTSERYTIDFDLEYFPELQADIEKTVKWMNQADCLTTNEKRELIKYGRDENDINGDKIIVSSGKKLLENIGLESFPGDPELTYDEDKDLENDK